MVIHSAKDALSYCEANGLSLLDLAVLYEIDYSETSQSMVYDRMLSYYQSMKKSIAIGLNRQANIKCSILKRHAINLDAYLEGETFSGSKLLRAVTYGLSVMEVNGGMGKIVAAPTAGASGVLPGVFLAVQEERQYKDRQIVEAMLIAALVGMIIAGNASVSGAKGGCQAEVGSAAGMAAAGLVHLAGGNNYQIFSAAATALKNLMGLVCDPVAGLVEVPCHKRNAIGIANAFVAADLELAGVSSYIPFDEVVGAMKQVGDLMPTCLRETGLGGIAMTETGLNYKEKIFGGGDNHEGTTTE